MLSLGRFDRPIDAALELPIDVERAFVGERQHRIMITPAKPEAGSIQQCVLYSPAPFPTRTCISHVMESGGPWLAPPQWGYSVGGVAAAGDQPVARQ